jgi:hypothetical protein
VATENISLAPKETCLVDFYDELRFPGAQPGETPFLFIGKTLTMGLLRRQPKRLLTCHNEYLYVWIILKKGNRVRRNSPTPVPLRHQHFRDEMAGNPHPTSGNATLRFGKVRECSNFSKPELCCAAQICDRRSSRRRPPRPGPMAGFAQPTSQCGGGKGGRGANFRRCARIVARQT